MRTSIVVALAAVVLAAGAPAARAADDPHQEAQKLIKKLAKEKDPRFRAMAARDLGRLKVPEAVPALAAALKDKDASVRADSAKALREMGEAAADAKPELQEALLDSDGMTVWYAASALHGMGVVRTDLMPAYRRLLQDPSCDMRTSAALAAREYATVAELLPVALACRRDKDVKVSTKAIQLMGSLMKVKAAVPALVEVLSASPTMDLREQAARSLGEIGAAAKEAIPALTKALSDREWQVRTAAATALGEMGALARSAVPALKAAAADQEAYVRAAAERALTKIEAK